MCPYMCTHTHTHTHTDAHVYTHMHTRTHVPIHVLTLTHIHTSMCTYMHAHTCAHMCTHRHVHIHIHTRMHVPIHVHARTLTHTYIHGHARMRIHTGSSHWLFQLCAALLLSPLLTCFSLSALYFLWELRPPLCDQRYRSKGRAGGFDGPAPSSSHETHHLHDPSNTIKAAMSQTEP